jgi:hypothetical protein
MKQFDRPGSSWLPQAAFDLILEGHDEAWSRVAVDLAAPSVPSESQNEAMLAKFFLEQAFGNSAVITGDLRSIIERDFGGVEGLHRSWLLAAVRPGVRYVVLGLSFADFRFHLFPIGGGAPPPFCVSPIACGCFRADVVALTTFGGDHFAQAQWRHIDWGVVAHRLACLSQPLDLFEEPEDCLDDECQPRAPRGSATASSPAPPPARG